MPLIADEALAELCRAFSRQKAGIVDDDDDYGFLPDYYAALCAKLEAGLMVGRRRESKLEGNNSQRLS